MIGYYVFEVNGEMGRLVASGSEDVESTDLETAKKIVFDRLQNEYPGARVLVFA